MTGAYVRIQRNGKWVKAEFDELANEEMESFTKEHPDDGWKWALFLARWIRDDAIKLGAHGYRGDLRTEADYG